MIGALAALLFSTHSTELDSVIGELTEIGHL